MGFTKALKPATVAIHQRAGEVADMSKGYPSGYDYVAPTEPMEEEMEEDKEWDF